MKLLFKFLEALAFAFLCTLFIFYILFQIIDGEAPETQEKEKTKSFSYCISTDARPCKLPEETE